MSSIKSNENQYKDKDINIQTITLLEKMKSLIKDISELLQQYQDKLKMYIADSKKVSDYLDNRINGLITYIKDQNDPNERDIVKDRKKMMDKIKEISNVYDQKIFIIYENNFLKNIRKSNQDLNEIINDYLPDPNFQPPNINSFTNGNSQPCINNSLIPEKDYSKSQSIIEGYNNFVELKNNDESLNIKDKINNAKISCKCTRCNQNEIINFCEECNQLFCESCYKLIKQSHQHKSIFFIDELKTELEQRRVLFINSLKYMIKSLLIKGNELLNNEYMKIGSSSSNSFENLFNSNSKNNSISKIKYIKKVIFNYPFIDQFNCDSELTFFFIS